VLRRERFAEVDHSVSVTDREGMGWRERGWAEPNELEREPVVMESSFARRRSSTTRAFAIAMLILFLLIALASLAHL
jgi:hypothetical protein